MTSLVRACALLAVLTLTACGGNSQPSPSTSGPSTSTPSTSASASACPPDGSTAEQESADPLAMSSMGGVTMRLGQHECAERFVFEMAGEGDPPGWTVGYRDPLVRDPSGKAVDLAGGSDLEVIVQAWTVTDPASSPVPGLPAFTGPTDIRSDGFEAIQEAQLLGAFEGVTQIGIGLDQERPFRAYWLDDPSRLVVDVFIDGEAS